MMFFCLLLLFVFRNVVAEPDDDLMSFVTLPHVRALKLNIAYYDREAVSPGYWFVAPYGTIDPEPPTQQWKPCQVGPYIYDADGVLVWAGSCMFENRGVFDFKAVPNIDDQPHLSFILQHGYQDAEDKGLGYVLDQHYEPEKAVPVTNDLSAFNMHDFNILDGGKTALACAYKSEWMNLGELGRPEEYGWVIAGGFVEMDTATGAVLNEWLSTGHIPIHESVKVHEDTPASDRPGWDHIHVNSIDKSPAGNYLLSARFCNTIYLISGEDGHIMWRLGGQYSDFDQDFTFSKQHHARFVETNSTHTTISFLNNASDELEQEEDVSAALFVQLDFTASPLTARVIGRYNRPDNGLTRLRGSVQQLDNGNVFVGWSEQGFQSEHSPDGKVLMQSTFASGRFSTYRSYKYPFTGRPSQPPDLVASVYGTEESDLTTIIHVSWNGATDVASWNFYARASQDGSPELVGNTTKYDFETMYIADGYFDWLSADALDRDGNVLGTSFLHRTTTPANWHLAGFQGDEDPTPADPAAPSAAEEAEMEQASAEQAETEQKEQEQKEEEEAQKEKAEEAAAQAAMDAEKAAESAFQASEFVHAVGGLLILILVACSVGGVVAAVVWSLRRRRTQAAYLEVPSDERPQMEE
ncbi:uncharacterized protein KD926_005741 [Aspergillus affinis]|uniref:uncharacterized protein n=1 Tax=Aspergillus affinis TaxID=1070780 RepID=UPI0022FE23F4|nr:uncharacterized protein KD926_005741 [Aspergillus affinis]KAI9042241.1 hypothetical protein KD926_005741 [Aspergillus affinis]